MLNLTGDNYEQKVIMYALIWLKFSYQGFLERIFLFSNLCVLCQKTENIKA